MCRICAERASRSRLDAIAGVETRAARRHLTVVRAKEDSGPSKRPFKTIGSSLRSTSIILQSSSTSSQIQLELLEAPIVQIAPRTTTHPPIPLVIHQCVNAHIAQPTDAVRACIALLQHVQPPTACAVDLYFCRCRRKHRACIVRVKTAGRHDVEVRS